MKTTSLSAFVAAGFALGLGFLAFADKRSEAGAANAKKNPVEIGLVQWERDFEAAKKTAADTGKPLFVLFQEVPGCAGCRKFGQEVLSDKRMVAAIEEGFVPMVVYNNQPGKDKELLKVYKEPA